MSEALAESEEALARFSREAAAASQVKSPHVVQMIDFGIATNGMPYIAMELLEGRDLSQILARYGTLDPEGVSKIVTQVARALMRAHEKGIVHRDLKPENIFLIDAGGGEIFAKVLDFGIAKSATIDNVRTTGTGMMIGTPLYMSPEQVLGSKTIDYRSDLWSLGVVAFEVLSGGPPFSGETVGAISVAICHAPIPKPSDRNPAIGHAVDAWFLRACAREANDRFASAKEMADALSVAVQQDAKREPAHSPVAPEITSTSVQAPSPLVSTMVEMSEPTQVWLPAPGRPTTIGASAVHRATTLESLRHRTRRQLVALVVGILVVSVGAFALVVRVRSGASQDESSSSPTRRPATTPSGELPMKNAPAAASSLEAVAGDVGPASSASEAPSQVGSATPSSSASTPVATSMPKPTFTVPTKPPAPKIVPAAPSASSKKSKKNVVIE